jgi:hypothetical protein
MARFEVNTTVTGFRRFDFEKKPVKKAMQHIGQKVQTDARRLVARKAISGGGDYPGRMTGALRSATRYKVSRPGFLVTIQPRATEGTVKGGEFYPAILYYGVKAGSRRRKDKKKQAAAGGYRIEPRKNWTVDAAEGRREYAQTIIMDALQAALVAR